MRVLSFIPALLLAAAGFVAAAPSAPNDAVALFARSSDVSAPTGSIPQSAQPIVDTATKATSQIKPLNDKLEFYKSNPDVDAVSAVVTQITAVIKVAVGELAEIKVDANVDLTGVLAVVLALVAEVVRTLTLLVAIVLALAGGVVAHLQQAIAALLEIVLALVAGLRILVVGTVAVVLAAVLDVVVGIVALLKIKVFVGVYA